MQLASIGFLVGVLVCQSLAELPSVAWCFLLVILIPTMLVLPRYRWLICVALGFLYSVFLAQYKMADQISATLEGRDLLITGVVASLPDQSAERSRFLFDMTDLSELADPVSIIPGANHNKIKMTKRLQLAWYQTAPQLEVGQQWQLLVRLKRPRGFHNPGGFDYEAWLYQHGIHATGYVRDTKATRSHNRLLGETQGIAVTLNKLRAHISSQIHLLMGASRQSELVAALVVGDRQGIDTEQWQVLTKTGTNHLMAISGLHIGLVAGLFFFLANRVWRLLPGVSLWIAAPRVAAVCAIIAALIYAALAGFSLPTQRAVIMVSIVMLAVWRQRPVVPSSVLAAALLAVLLFDPTAVMSGSFWLSFGAVAVIFYTMTGRLSTRNWWWKWGRVQWIIAVGLTPVLLFVFQQVPLLSPVANFVAVPLVSFITVPFSLLGSALLLLGPSVAQWPLNLAGLSLDALWPLLSFLADLDYLVWTGSEPPLWTLPLALFGLLILLAPNGIPGRWLGVLWLLPLVFFPRSEIPHGALRLTVLDVGHGLASVVQTQNHILLYDVGPRFSDEFNAGSVAVIPFLKSQGIHHVDRVVLSHDDIDHTGGFASVRDQLDIESVMVGPRVPYAIANTETCTAGMQWNWDGVDFRVLHPAADFQSDRDNNLSCVVQISTESDKLLLTGDMEREVENELVKFFAADDDNLSADVVVVPHHGSASSSSARFVQAVSAKYALISVGYRNRYGLPKPEVVDRYRSQGAKVLDTANSGAITLVLGAAEDARPEWYRQRYRRYWSSVTQ